MSNVGTYSPEDFVADYELDFGGNVRGSYFAQYGKRAGMLLAHYKPGGEVCAGTVWFIPAVVGKRTHPLWSILKEEPLTLTPSIKCDCGLHGFIENGLWHT